MLRDMKETCTEAMMEDAIVHPCITWIFLPLRTMHKVPFTVQEDVKTPKFDLITYI